MPTIEAWLQGAVADAARSSREGVGPVLEALAQACSAIRRADWNADAARDGDRPVETTPAARRG
jgi:hypothetical protein